jgi:type VI secretion system protein ImpK
MFLLDKFQQFHSELVRLKTRVAAGAWVFQGEENALGESAARESPTAVWRRLSSLLERQSLEAGSQGGDFAVELYRRAQYAMAALADEVFLNVDWVGRDSWREHLLEAKFFGSHRAGEELFDRIEELLHNRESLFAELGRVYLIVLGLGFQGQYRGRPDAEETIAVYRRRLFRFVFNRDPMALRGDQYVVPQAYAATLDEAVTTELPDLRPWFWAMAASLLLWAGGTYAAWRYSTSVLTPLITRISADDQKERQEEAREGSASETETDSDTDPEAGSGEAH